MERIVLAFQTGGCAPIYRIWPCRSLVGRSSWIFTKRYSNTVRMAHALGPLAWGQREARSLLPYCDGNRATLLAEVKVVSSVYRDNVRNLIDS